MSVNSTSAAPVLDVEGTLIRFGGDRQLFAEMAGMLLEDVPRVFADLQRAVASQDATAVRMQAHALKGLVAGCGGVRAAAAAQVLEDAGSSGDLSQTAMQIELLASELDLLTDALLPYRS